MQWIQICHLEPSSIESSHPFNQLNGAHYRNITIFIHFVTTSFTVLKINLQIQKNIEMIETM